MRSFRSIAQPGRVLRSGRRGRGFEPRYSDHKIKIDLAPVFILCLGVRGRYPTLCNNVGSTMSKREQVHNAVRVLTNAPQASTMPREPQDEDHKIKIGLAPVFIL